MQPVQNMWHTFFSPFILLPSASPPPRFNTLNVVTNNASESRIGQNKQTKKKNQRYLDKSSPCEHSGADKRTPTGRPRPLWMITVDSECQAMGQISCAVMHEPPAIWGAPCVCAHVLHMGQSLAGPKVDCIDQFSNGWPQFKPETWQQLPKQGTLTWAVVYSMLMYLCGFF